VEMFYVKTSDHERVAAIVADRLKSQPSELGTQPDWGLPSSGT
jgi:hypothetical protein